MNSHKIQLKAACFIIYIYIPEFLMYNKSTAVTSSLNNLIT